ncbi:MAG: NAD(P)-dependent oxidoreductase [Parvibaculum sp.]|nr:NAD(P)-dependent oxidoreductase [Parvibaculum sp.]
MRILVTGASGFVGRAVLPPLLAAGAEVHAVSRTGGAAVDGCIWHRADLMEADRVHALVGDVRPQIVLHLAWCVEHGRFWTDPANLDWVAASLHLARAAAEAGASRFVATGTCYEYDWPDQGKCRECETPTAPHTLYDTSKDACRRILEAFFAQQGMDFAWGRLFFLYGAGETPSRLVASIARALVQGHKAPVSLGLAVRDFVDVRDAGAALAALALSAATGPVNIATGEGISVANLAMKLGEIAGRPNLVQLGALEDRAGEPPVIVADTERLTSEIGFRPLRTIDKGLGDALDYWASRLGQIDRTPG